MVSGKYEQACYLYSQLSGISRLAGSWVSSSPFASSTCSCVRPSAPRRLAPLKSVLLRLAFLKVVEVVSTTSTKKQGRVDD